MLLEHKSEEAKIPKQPKTDKDVGTNQLTIATTVGVIPLIDELKGIKAFELVSKSANVFEKLVWGVIFIGGMMWAAHFLKNEFHSWQVHPTIISNKNVT